MSDASPEHRATAPVDFTPATTGPWAKLDPLVADHPWHPRIVPFFVYLVLMMITGQATSYAPEAIQPWVHAGFYALQCGIVCMLLWRYRRLTPELTIRWHWLALPVAVFVTVAWIGIGWAMAGEFGERWAAMLAGEPLPRIDYGPTEEAAGMFATTEPHDFELWLDASPAAAWTALALRLLGMSIVVPLFEELFIRSLMLRSLHHPKPTGRGLLAVLVDLPVIGDLLLKTKWGKVGEQTGPVFTEQFVTTPVGHLTVFAIAASTFVFMLSHVPRDWPAIWVCGIAWCLLLGVACRFGKRPEVGIGSVVWSHGICNAQLWAYSAWTGDWQFL